MSTAGNYQISGDASGVVAVIALPSNELAKKSGVTADDTAAFVPNFTASRRLILLLICSSHCSRGTISLPTQRSAGPQTGPLSAALLIALAIRKLPASHRFTPPR